MLNPKTTEYISDKIFRLLFHEDAPVHIKSLSVLTAANFEYEVILDILKSDNKFQSEDLISWALDPDFRFTNQKRPISDVEFIVTDIEATGPEFDKDRIIELGAVKVKNGQIVDEFHSFVNPERSVPWQIYRLTGIKKNQLEEAPDISCVLPKFVAFWGQGVFCAHNSDFDLNFIQSETNRLQINSSYYEPELCTLRLAKKLIPDVKYYGITALTEYFDYLLKKQHSAIEDAKATAFCLNKMIEKFNENNDKTCGDLIVKQRRCRGKSQLNKDAKRRQYRQKLKRMSS